MSSSPASDVTASPECSVELMIESPVERERKSYKIGCGKGCQQLYSEFQGCGEQNIQSDNTLHKKRGSVVDALGPDAWPNAAEGQPLLPYYLHEMQRVGQSTSCPFCCRDDYRYQFFHTNVNLAPGYWPFYLELARVDRYCPISERAQRI